MNSLIDRESLLRRARGFAERAQDDAAKQAYIEVLRQDPASLTALSELGALAAASGYRSAACTAYRQAIHHHPDNPIGHVGLANLLVEDGDQGGARLHYEAALQADPDYAGAHQGLARLLTGLGETADAEPHWEKGFVGHAVVKQWYRGDGPGIPLLLLVSARGGNVPTRQWIDDRTFAVTAIHAEYFNQAEPLPPHDIVVNAIGDADLCGTALERAEAIVAKCTRPVINLPALVGKTGRENNARLLAGLPGVRTPRTVLLERSALLASQDLRFPLLLRSPGFHTGQHFVYVKAADGLPGAAARLPGEALLAIEYLDARGSDLMVRKYRVMFIDGVCYPLHLAMSADWKVHYFTAAMADSAAYRQEEQRFLQDMPTVIGKPAMSALAAVAALLGLDYGGIDFGLSPDGTVLLFEANATMVIIPPAPDLIWDYRRPAIAAVQEAARRMVLRRARSG